MNLQPRQQKSWQTTKYKLLIDFFYPILVSFASLVISAKEFKEIKNCSRWADKRAWGDLFLSIFLTTFLFSFSPFGDRSRGAFVHHHTFNSASTKWKKRNKFNKWKKCWRSCQGRGWWWPMEFFKNFLFPATDRECEKQSNLKICRVVRYTFEDKKIRRGSKDFFLIISIRILLLHRNDARRKQKQI